MSRGRYPEPIARRLAKMIDKNGPLRPGQETPCWVWTGPVTDKGYGRFRTPERWVRANRLVWEKVNGPVAPDHDVTMTCGNRLCVRHLEVIDHDALLKKSQASHARKPIPQESPAMETAGVTHDGT